MMPKRGFTTNQFLAMFDKYISSVQDEMHVKRARVAIVWSVIFLFYFFGVVSVENKDALQVFGMSITFVFPGAIFGFLWVMTMFYVLRFLYAAANIFAKTNPFFFRGEIKMYKKKERKEFKFETKKEYEELSPYMQLHSWSTQRSVQVPKIVDPEFPNRRFAHNVTFIDIHATLEKEHEVRHNLQRPFFGFLENFLFPVYLPTTVCAVTALVLLWQLWQFVKNLFS